MPSVTRADQRSHVFGAYIRRKTDGMSGRQCQRSYMTIATRQCTALRHGGYKAQHAGN